MRGYFWPKVLDELNIQFSKHPKVEIDSDVKSRCMEYIDSTVSKASTAECLKSKFCLSEQESTKLEDNILR